MTGSSCVLKRSSSYSAPKKEMGGGDCWFGPDRKGEMESGRFGVLLWQRDFACIPCLLRSGAEERCMEEISGVGSWECGRMGKPREKQVRGVRLL